MKTPNHNVKELWKLVLHIMGILLFPPSRRRLRILRRISWLLFKHLFDLARNPESTFLGLMEEAANIQAEELDSTDQRNNFATLDQLRLKLPKILKSLVKEELLPLYYGYETMAWTQAILGSKDSQVLYSNISKRVNRVLEGRTKPLFVPFKIENPDAELVAYLHLNDAVRAIEHIEKIPVERVLSLISADTALIHLVTTDDGTFAIITQKDLPSEIILCSSFTRQRVENLLRGWMWLYYFHREKSEIYDQIAKRVIQRHKMSQKAKEGFKEAYQRIPYELLFYNQTLFEYLQPTELPTNDSIPAIPFPSWLLMEAILRELGRGDLVSDNGLWQRLHEKLSLREVKRIVLCSDSALALFPHHAAILNIDRDGRKECLLDSYEITYLPQGKLAQVTPAKSQPPRLSVFGTDGEVWAEVGIASIRTLLPERIGELHGYAEVEKLMTETPEINALTFLGHGEYNWESPEQSYLGLEKDRNGTGFNDTITLENLIEQIPPELDLITLAGCETGLPKITVQVSEYKGFAEDLLLRHCASTIVATLWPVLQVSTALLMRQFHSYWLLGDGVTCEKSLPPVTVLRKAQLWLRSLRREQVITELEVLASVHPSEEITKAIQELHASMVEYPYAHPYFWSTFYVMGGVL